MPLRSVEAATRDDAIAAAREQFGPHARVVGVRRVRSGGVLGFFATERYVAEVADQFTRPGTPAPSAGPAAAAPVASYDSPLASAAPARAAAPARNGAAAWAAEAARSGSAPVAASRPAPGSRAVVQPTVAAPSDDERLEELVGLLGATPPAPRTQSAPRTASTPRTASGPRTVARTTPAAAPRSASAGTARTAEPAPAFPRASSATATRTPAAAPADAEPPTSDAPAGPSPFTAALARMVAGDRDVRQAVAEALEQPAGRSLDEPAPRPRERRRAEPPEPPAARPSLAAAIRSADPSMRSKAVHQEETTVGEQVVTPPSPSTAGPADAPAWVAPQQSPAPAASSRQEEIAEALRSALAQGHSDEALAGILRKMLAGNDPQQALAEPVAEPVAEVVAAPVAEVVAAPVADGSADAVPAPVEPVATPDVAPLVAEVAASWHLGSSSSSLFGAPAEPPVTADLRWDAPTADAPAPGSSSLWGEAPAAAEAPLEAADAPIWAEVALGGPVSAPVAAPVADLPAEDAPSAGGLFGNALFGDATAPGPLSPGTLSTGAAVPTEATGPVADATPAPLTASSAEEPAAPAAAAAAEEPAVEDVAVVAEPAPAADEPAVEDVAVEAEPVAEPVAEVLTAAAEVEQAPLLARTASDPAPMTMSSDATTVMPRVSLRPSRTGSGSRGRGLPPVPPPSGRPPVPPARRAPAAGAPVVPEVREQTPAGNAQEDVAADSRTSSTPGRPARALATVTRLPVAPLMAGPDVPDMPELDQEPADGTSMWAASRTGARTPEEVVAGLVALGLPRDLLGPAFPAALAANGTYAALTSALAAALPEVPEVPSGAGEVLFLVGPGVETLRAARALAVSLRQDPDRVQWATRGDLAGLAPKASRMTTVDAAVDRRAEATTAGMLTIVAVDAPLRSDAYWMTRMLTVWSPTAVWAVVEATRKPEDLEVWLNGLARVDALAVQDTDLSADPAAVLRRLAAPVVLLDGVRATPHRWASLLCERLDTPRA